MSRKTTWWHNDVEVLQVVGTDRKALCTYAIYERYHTISSYVNKSNCNTHPAGCHSSTAQQQLNLTELPQLCGKSLPCHNNVVHSFTLLQAHIHCTSLEATASRMLLAVRLATFCEETLALEVHLTRLCKHIKLTAVVSLQCWLSL